MFDTEESIYMFCELVLHSLCIMQWRSEQSIGSPPFDAAASHIQFQTLAREWSEYIKAAEKKCRFQFTIHKQHPLTLLVLKLICLTPIYWFILSVDPGVSIKARVEFPPIVGVMRDNGTQSEPLLGSHRIVGAPKSLMISFSARYSTSCVVNVGQIYTCTNNMGGGGYYV